MKDVLKEFLGLFAQLNDSLKSVKQIRFNVQTLIVLKRILQELSKLKYVEEVTISFDSKPEYFCSKTVSSEEYRNLFPRKMKNISKITILTNDKPKICEHFPTILPSNLSYQVQFGNHEKFELDLATKSIVSSYYENDSDSDDESDQKE